MKRILAAVVIALLFHALLFYIKPSWLNNKPLVKKAPAIAITMSYKRPVAPPPVKKKPVEVKKKTVKPKKTEKKPAPVKVKEKAIEPVPIKEETIEEKIDALEEVQDEPVIMTSEETYESSAVTDNVVSDVIIEAEPLYRMNPEPGYPRMARKRGYEGTVLLSVLVNKEGRVENLWVFESCGYNILDNAALDAVKDWIFEPGRQNDEPVEMWVQVPVIFKLE